MSLLNAVSLKGFMIDDLSPLEIDQSLSDWSSGTFSTSIDFVHMEEYYRYDRITYSILDYLRDIGGVLSSFNSFFTALIFIVNYNGLYQWLTSVLYKVESSNYEISRHR